MSQGKKKYLRFRIYLILKAFSIIGAIIVISACKNQKGKLKSVVKKSNNIYLEKPEVHQDTTQSADIPRKIDTIPAYEPPVEIICDYGVIQVVEPPIIETTLYGVVPDIEEFDPQND